MNEVHIHLLLNHFPIIGTLLCLLLLMAGFIFKNKTMRNSALCGFVLMALITIPAHYTGDGAQDAVKNLPGINKETIEEHEEAGDTALWLMIGLGAISLVGLFFRNHLKYAYPLQLFALVAAIGISVFMYQVGYTGGLIRHPEISNAVPGNTNQKPGDQDGD